MRFADRTGLRAEVHGDGDDLAARRGVIELPRTLCIPKSKVRPQGHGLNQIVVRCPRCAGSLTYVSRIHAQNKGLVKIVGKAEVLGRPMLYGTTKKFLEIFGLNTLKDLPKIEELKKPEQ